MRLVVLLVGGLVSGLFAKRYGLDLGQMLAVEVPIASGAGPCVQARLVAHLWACRRAWRPRAWP